MISFFCHELHSLIQLENKFNLSVSIRGRLFEADKYLTYCKPIGSYSFRGFIQFTSCSVIFNIILLDYVNDLCRRKPKNNSRYWRILWLTLLPFRLVVSFLTRSQKDPSPVSVVPWQPENNQCTQTIQERQQRHYDDLRSLGVTGRLPLAP